MRADDVPPPQPAVSAAARVVVVDDHETSRDAMAGILTRDGCVVSSAADGEAGLELVIRERPDVVVSDILMPKLDGFELCRRLKANYETRLTPVVLITGAGERDFRLRGIEVGADDFLVKPVSSEEMRARIRSLVRVKRITDELESAESVLLSLGATVEARDGYTRGHCDRLAAYSVAFGRSLGLSEEEIAALRRGGYLHDVGKIGVPDSVLLKPGRLTDDEFAAMRRHPVIGESVCGDLRSLRLVRPIVRYHHERLDGSGYPDGLHGDSIPLLAQITGIVDVYDALTTDRPYRRAMSREAAFAELRRESEAGWRSIHLVDAFLALALSGQFGALPPTART
jgi:putative two-component system response regulator